MLPNFFVIGAYRSGTTSLNSYLAMHPQVFVPRIKEPSFFAFAAAGLESSTLVYRNSVKTRAEYEALYEDAGGFAAVGDVSPEYMTSSIAASTIRRHVPHAKLIAILRNPVERAYSDFLMYRRDGREKETDFARALAMQAERAAASDPTGYYISTGYYGEQLARFYDCFSASRIKVFLMEELQADGPGTLSQIFAFLGVDPTFIPGRLAVLNRSGVPSSMLVRKVFQYEGLLAPAARYIVPKRLRSLVWRKLEENLERPSLSPDIRRSLAEAYAPDVELLERLTGKSCRHWVA
jgi:Sulfotransferase family